MRFSQAKLRIVVIALIISSTLLLLPARRAHAYYGSGEAVLVAGIIAVWLTYVTAKSLVCTPVAVFNSAKNENGFGGEFKACWDWKPGSSTEADEASSTKVADLPPSTGTTNEKLKNTEGQTPQE